MSVDEQKTMNKAENHAWSAIVSLGMSAQNSMVRYINFLLASTVVAGILFLFIFEFAVHEVSFYSMGLLDGQLTTIWLLLFHLFASLCSLLQSPRLEKHFGVSFVIIRFAIGELLSEVVSWVGLVFLDSSFNLQDKRNTSVSYLSLSTS